MFEDSLRIFDRLRTATRAGPAPTLAKRRALLDQLRALLVDHRDDLAAAISADFGNRAAIETDLMEMVPVLGGIRHARRRLGHWMRDVRRPVAATFQPARAWIRHEPLGVIGIVAPWNYPLALSLAPLTAALAAGNRAMVKPSEATPAFAELLARLVERYFPGGEVAVVTGDVEVSKQFVRLPFDHLVFTGSTAVGREVMRAAAENLTPVTLELGGKSPAIVCSDYATATAARSIAFGKFVNAGQTCIAPDYVLAPADRAEDIAAALVEAADRAYPDAVANSDYAGLVLDKSRDRLIAAVEEAAAAGAKVLTSDTSARNGKLAPTVVLDPPLDGALMCEEIFGPVLPVVRYETLDEALAFVTARDRPLALYCFSKDRQTTARVLATATSGGVTLNGTLLHYAQDDLPFGGVGASGMGAYHGQEGFRRLSHSRSVFEVGFVNAFERMGPPWGRMAKLAARVLAR